MSTANNPSAGSAPAADATANANALPSNLENADLKALVQGAISDGINRATSALDEVRTKVTEYDEQYKASETAQSYLDSALVRARNAVDELKKVGDKVKTAPAAQLPIMLVQGALVRVNSALLVIKEQAKAYDEQIKSTANSTASSISSIIATARDRGTLAIAEASAQVFQVQEALRQSAAALPGKLQEYDEMYQISKKVQEYDDYYGISGKVSAAAEKVKELDEKYGVSTKARELDQNYTGGMGAAAVGKVGEGVGYVSAKAAAYANPEGSNTAAQGTAGSLNASQTGSSGASNSSADAKMSEAQQQEKSVQGAQ